MPERNRYQPRRSLYRVHDFLAQKKIAVVGVSDKRETGCNLGYRKFRGRGMPFTPSIRA